MTRPSQASAPDAQTPRLPVTTVNDAIPYLRRPFTPEAIKFKVQSTWATGALIVAYIDARLVVERLNHVVGGNWHADYRQTENPKLMWCDLRVFGTTRSDLGETTKAGLSKDLVSDALKRAAVHFGVGVSIYALPQIRLSVGPLLEKRDKGGIVLTDKGHDQLRAGYAKWLKDKNTFGEPFDHGDVEGQIDEPEEFVPGLPAAVESDAAQMLREKATELYTELGPKASGMTQAQFDGRLAGVAWSEAELRRFVDFLAAKRPEVAA